MTSNRYNDALMLMITGLCRTRNTCYKLGPMQSDALISQRYLLFQTDDALACTRPRLALTAARQFDLDERVLVLKTSSSRQAFFLAEEQSSSKYGWRWCSRKLPSHPVDQWWPRCNRSVRMSAQAFLSQCVHGSVRLQPAGEVIEFNFKFLQHRRDKLTCTGMDNFLN